MSPHSPQSTLFPYTTLFRSRPWRTFGQTGLCISSETSIPRPPRKTNLDMSKRQNRCRELQPFPCHHSHVVECRTRPGARDFSLDRKSTRLNSSHVEISYAVF